MINYPFPPRPPAQGPEPDADPPRPPLPYVYTKIERAFALGLRTPVIRPMVLGPALKKADPSPPSPPILKAWIETRPIRTIEKMISAFISTEL